MSENGETNGNGNGTGRGGARAGAGRKKSSSSPRVVSVRMPAEEIAEIDRLAKRANLDRQSWIRREIRRALQKTRPR